MRLVTAAEADGDPKNSGFQHRRQTKVSAISTSTKSAAGAGPPRAGFSETRIEAAKTSGLKKNVTGSIA